MGFHSPFSLFHFLPFFSHLLTQPLHQGLQEKQEMEIQLVPMVPVVSLEMNKEEAATVSSRDFFSWSFYLSLIIMNNSENLYTYMCSIAQSCLTLCGPMDCTLPGSSAHGIFQARISEWVAVPFSRGSSQTRYQTQVSCIAGRVFTI